MNGGPCNDTIESCDRLTSEFRRLLVPELDDGVSVPVEPVTPASTMVRPVRVERLPRHTGPNDGVATPTCTPSIVIGRVALAVRRRGEAYEGDARPGLVLVLLSLFVVPFVCRIGRSARNVSSALAGGVVA